MKRNKLIPLILLVVLSAAFFLLKQQDNTQKLRNLVNLDVSKLDSIEIWNSEDRINLVLDEGEWKLTDPVLWPADTLMIRLFFEELVNAKHPRLAISEDQAAIARYNLDEDKALHIRLKAGNKSDHLLFGNIGNAWDYFRRAKDNTVYQTRTRIVQDFSPLIMNWRNPLVIHYWEDELAELRVEHEKNKYTLTRDGLRWTFKDANHEFDVVGHNFALTKIVSILQNFRSFSFISGEDPGIKALFQNPLSTVWITDTEGKTRKLSFAKYLDERYVMLLDDDYTVLYQVEFDTVFRFTRNPEIFMRTSPI
jgi:hypothetical protein